MAAAVLLFAACNGEETLFTPTVTQSGTAGLEVTPTPTATAPASTSPGAEPTATPSPTPEVDPAVRLRSLLLSGLTAGLATPAPAAALEEIEVLVQPLEHPDRELWLAVTSGSGIYELTDARHLIA
ncbi:MAG: hypothetical protein WD058_00930, partial [Dehalococcoidia bacterium]